MVLVFARCAADSMAVLGVLLVDLILPLMVFRDRLVPHLLWSESAALTEAVGDGGQAWRVDRSPVGSGLHATMLGGMPRAMLGS